MRYWTSRQWLTAVACSIGVAVVLGVVTDLVPNPLFTRMIVAPWWSYPVWIASAVLSGLLAATYVTPRGQRPSGVARAPRRGVVGAVLSFLAVGCPTCNKLVVVALGTSGAVSWFGPVQPVLAVGSLVLLGVALRARLRVVDRCPTGDGKEADECGVSVHSRQR